MLPIQQGLARTHQDLSGRLRGTDVTHTGLENTYVQDSSRSTSFLNLFFSFSAALILAVFIVFLDDSKNPLNCATAWRRMSTSINYFFANYIVHKSQGSTETHRHEDFWARDGVYSRHLH